MLNEHRTCRTCILHLRKVYMWMREFKRPRNKHVREIYPARSTSSKNASLIKKTPGNSCRCNGNFFFYFGKRYINVVNLKRILFAFKVHELNYRICICCREERAKHYEFSSLFKFVADNNYHRNLSEETIRLVVSAWNFCIFLLFLSLLSGQIIMLFCLCSYQREILIMESRFERDKRARKGESEIRARICFGPLESNRMTKFMPLVCRHDIISPIFRCIFRFGLSRLDTYFIALSILTMMISNDRTLIRSRFSSLKVVFDSWKRSSKINFARSKIIFYTKFNFS